MPKFVIEREIPGIGSWSAGSCRKPPGSHGRSSGARPDIQWLTSYVTDDRLYCVYIPPSPDLIKEHAARGGFPCDRITEVRMDGDPTTAEGRS